MTGEALCLLIRWLVASICWWLSSRWSSSPANIPEERKMRRRMKMNCETAWLVNLMVGIWREVPTFENTKVIWSSNLVYRHVFCHTGIVSHTWNRHRNTSMEQALGIQAWNYRHGTSGMEIHTWNKHERNRHGNACIMFCMERAWIYIYMEKYGYSCMEKAMK